jgi:protein-S-isoprenylcysteine O-methyltransferase Ste14
MYLALGIAVTILFYAAFGVLLFWSAGTLNVPAFWIYLGVMTVLCVVSSVYINVRSPDLVKERLRPGKGEQDKVTLTVMWIAFILQGVIAGVDVGRYHWSSNVPTPIQYASLILLIAGFVFVLWAMLVNRFFSSAVRIQSDRGQQVIDSGPYRIVRHPGYTGGMLFLLCSSITLGSWLSLLPMVVVCLFMIRRTQLEDSMLQKELPGYTEYTKKVRYRLIPGVW